MKRKKKLFLIKQIVRWFEKSFECDKEQNIGRFAIDHGNFVNAFTFA